MKKGILIFTAAVVFAAFLSGCSSEEGPSELDSIIEQLQTTHLNTGSPEENPITEEAIPYKSLTGAVISFNGSEITVITDGKEQKFALDENTQILGGSCDKAKTVTITYCEPEKKSKSTIANVITILELTADSIIFETTEPIETENAESVSDTVSDTTAENTSELITASTQDTAVDLTPDTQTEAAETETSEQADTEASEQTDTEASVQTETEAEPQPDNETNTQTENEDTETPTESETNA